MQALIIGGGPAGLMAADELSRAGAEVTIAEAKPSFGRKFLMAGKSGLNITKDEPLDVFYRRFAEAQSWLAPMLDAFGPDEVKQLATELEQPIFTGTSGRVFPKAMKASPLLRAWLARLARQGVRFEAKWRWTDWADGVFSFETPQGRQSVSPEVVVFALGGASWARLGSDGQLASLFADKEIELASFAGANAGVTVAWSSYMRAHFGTPLKAIALTSGAYASRAEAVISAHGLEGSGIYSVSRGLREGHDLHIDLRPDWSLERVETALQRPRGRASISNHMRRVLKLKKHEAALLTEWARPLPSDALELAKLIKHLKVQSTGLQPMDHAISTSGGVMQEAFDEDLMLRNHAGVFCAGEMLDWEAPTGGYLLTACLATGRTAGRGAARYLGLTPAP